MIKHSVALIGDGLIVIDRIIRVYAHARESIAVLCKFTLKKGIEHFKALVYLAKVTADAH